MSGELVADVAKTLANSASPLTLRQLANCYLGQYSLEYVRRAAIASLQLGLIVSDGSGYACSEKRRDLLKKASKIELKFEFREGLQDYGPFLLYADYLSKGFNPVEASIRTRGLFEIEQSADRLERTFKAWGKYAELIEDTGVGLKIKVNTEHLLFDYVKKLVEALEAELRAKLFAIDMLGPEVFTYLDRNDIKLDDIAKALRNYETDPKPSAGRSLEIFERFVHTIAEERGVDVRKPKGLMDWVDGLHSKNDLPANLWHVCRGMVGMRNMTHHNPDSETGLEWNISFKLALTSALLVSIMIRTVFLYVNQRKQEF